MNKFLDSNGVLYFWGKIKTALLEKVDKVEGKGLSANDFTDEFKKKLEDIDGTAGSVDWENIENKPTDLLTEEDISALRTQVQANQTALSSHDNTLNSHDNTITDLNTRMGEAETELDSIKASVVGVYKYKGSVAAIANLPTENNAVGDVYDVKATGMNYAWTGTNWDALGMTLQIDAITNAEIDTIMGS